MMQFDIGNIINALQSTYGKDFIDTIAMQLHKAIGARYTFIARVDKERYVSKIMTMVDGDDFGDTFEYSLEHTPCANVISETTCVYPTKISSFYPRDQLLIDMGVDGFIGAPLYDSTGQVFGLVVALYDEPIENAEDIGDLFELFAGRIAAELERSEKELALNELNQSLEEKVIARTSELEKTIEKLKDSQKQLIEQEKLASLGRLVAGVAHEVNTPLGVAVLGNSTVLSSVQKLATKFQQNALSKSDLERFIADTVEATKGVEFNLNRASELISNFKQMASDFHSDPLVEINLCEWVCSISTSLKPMLRKYNITFNMQVPDEGILVTTYPSRLAQVITNLVSNSVIHGFPENDTGKDKQIGIEVAGDENAYSIVVSDNGAGMDAKTKEKVLDPFFTTSRSSGSMGLGLSIVHNLVTDSLHGKLKVDTQPGEGTKVTLQF